MSSSPPTYHVIQLKLSSGIYYTYSKTRLTENAFPLTPALTLKHNNVFGLTK